MKHGQRTKSEKQDGAAYIGLIEQAGNVEGSLARIVDNIDIGTVLEQ
jgi:hypothetical protein